MTSYRWCKPFAVATGSLLLLLLFVCPSGAADPLARAAAELRGKEYEAAYISAKGAPPSPGRSLLAGVAALRSGKPDEAAPFLAEAEQNLPLVADYAALYQVEALRKRKRYAEAVAKASAMARRFPSSQLLRRSEKLAADALFDAGDYTGALKAYLGFAERYASGSDSIDALFQAARCREETGDKGGAAQAYRAIWLNNPASPQAKRSEEQLKRLEQAGIKGKLPTAEELLRRATSLYSQAEFGAAVQTLQSIPRNDQPAAFVARVDLKSGMAHYRLRNWSQAEKSLSRAAASAIAGIRSEARFWLAKTLERQDQREQAFAIYMELAGEGKKQLFADDALMEAAGLRRNQGRYAEAATLFAGVAKGRPDSRFAPRAAWEAAWCRYLAGDYGAAAESFRGMLKDENFREKALYWLARTLENSGSTEAATWYRTLLEEYPAGFYATWYRDQRGIQDGRVGLGQRNVLDELPLLPGFERPRLLASLGLAEEARAEMAILIKKNSDSKKLFPGLARLYLEMGEYGSAIALFLQNRPLRWERETLPLWSAGYPLAYGALVGRYAAANSLPESLIYAVIRAESGFSAAIRSPAGAIGLMQLMSSTARQAARDTGTFDPQRLTVPDFNIMLGARHLRELLDGYGGDVTYAVAAYNAGSAAVGRWRNSLKGLRKDEFIESIPYQETRDYVKKVYASAATYRQLYGLR